MRALEFREERHAMERHAIERHAIERHAIGAAKECLSGRR